MDLALPRAECGCPIRAAGTATEFVDHCQACIESTPVKARVSDERVQEILDGLNGFVKREYDGGTHIVNGAAVPCASVIGCDANLDKAVDWAMDLPDVAIAFGPDADGSAEVELADGTVIEWEPARKQWTVTISDECDTESGVSQ